MLDKTNDCLNSLRVTTTNWPGFVIYQGLTTKTALCSSKMTNPTGNETKREKLSRYGHRRINLTNSSIVREKAIESEMTDKNGQEENNTISNSLSDTCRQCDLQVAPGNVLNKHKHTTTNCSNSSSRQRSMSEDSSTSSTSSASSDRSKQHNVQQHERKLFAMSSVSCNEMPSGEDGQLQVFTKDGELRMPPKTLVTVNGQLRPRPHTAGPRVLVPPKHSCPAGLTDQDFVQGQGLGKKVRPSTGQRDSLNRNRKGVPGESVERTIEARNSPDWRTCHPSASCSNTQNCVCLVHPSNNTCPFRRVDRQPMIQRLSRGHLRFSSNDENVVPLELTITALTLGEISVGGSYHEAQVEPQMESTVVETEQSCGHVASEQRCRPASNTTNHSFSTDTIEGIKKSYQRAHSAPPTHSDGHVGSGHSSDSIGNADTKQFSNLYYRAKSAYHRRQETESGDDLDNQTTCTSRGSLLRPLLRPDSHSPAKHGDGCPYKCKNCFKACLVSQDYVQKAIARAMMEQEKQKQQQQQEQKCSLSASSTAPKSTATIKHPKSVSKSVSLVNQALGRNQPLFHRVYGHQGRAGRQRIRARPWPRYGWVDLKVHRDGQREEVSGDCSNKEEL